MENLNNKEIIKKELNKGFATLKKYWNLQKANRELHDKQRYFWEDNKASLDIMELYESKKEEYANLENETKKNAEKLDVLENTINIIKNNLKIRINYILRNDLKEKLLKYTTKNIGDKTKEKIIEEVENYFKNEFDMIVSFNFWDVQTWNNTKENSITFSIAESYELQKGYYDKEYKAYKNILQVNNNKNIEFHLYTLNNAENISRYDNIEEYNEINGKYYKLIDYINDLQIVEFEKIDTYAKEIVKERKKTIEKIEKAKKELNALFDSFNHKPFTSGFLSNNYIDRSKI